jgi:hypothetical protein
MILRLKAVKPDYLPGTDSLSVAPASGPWVVLSATALDDDASAPSAGDGDGLADAGETLQLRLELHNVGAGGASGVAIAVACADPRVTLTDPAAGYGTLAPGARAYNADDLVASLDGAIADGEEIPFTLAVTADGRPVWQSGFRLTVHAPILSLAQWAIDDGATGDGQGDADPNEAFALRVGLANAGSGEARGLTAVLACGSAYLQLTQSESGCLLVPAGGSADLVPPFAAALDWAAPTDSVLHFDLRVTTGAGQTTALAFDIPVASAFEDDLEAENDWPVGSPMDNATSGIWTHVDPVGTFMGGHPVQPEDDHTPLGTKCYVTGQGTPGGSPLVSDVDGGRTTLYTPTIDLRGAHEPRLVYWRWYTNNLGPYPSEDFWRVAISDDGGASWVTLEQTTESRNEWVRMEFDLASLIDLTDRVVVRFVASDQGGDSVVEAAVDDVAIETAPFNPSGAPEAAPEAIAFGIRALAPNPLNAGGAGLRITYGLPAAGRVALQIFGVDGALLRTLERGPRAAGEHRLVWDGRDRSGALQPSGIYFLRLRAGQADSRARVVIVR